MDKNITQLRTGIQALQLEISDEVLQKMLAFMAILIKWNKAYNLTAITNEADIISHHFLDSLSILPYIKANRILDVGSGAGFPGIPLALALPEKNFVLLDGNGKKTRFMTQVALLLQLKNIEIVQSRVEDYFPETCFDMMMARAFSAIDKFLGLTQHLLCPQGEILLMKGIYPDDELQKASIHAKVYEIFVPGLHETRHLISIKKDA